MKPFTNNVTVDFETSFSKVIFDTNLALMCYITLFLISSLYYLFHEDAKLLRFTHSVTSKRPQSLENISEALEICIYFQHNVQIPTHSLPSE